MSGSRKLRFPFLFPLAADFFAMVAAYYTAMLIRFHSTLERKLFGPLNRFLGVRESGEVGEKLARYYSENALRIVLMLTATVCILYALRDLYAGRRFLRRRPVAWNVIVANTIALGLFYAYFYLRRNVFHPRSFFALVLCLNVLYCVSFRWLADLLLDRIRARWGTDRHGVILVGSGPEASLIAELIHWEHPHGLYVVDRLEVAPAGDFPGLLRQLQERLRSGNADMIVVAEPALGVAQLMCILEMAGQMDVAVKILSPHLDVLVTYASVACDMIHGAPLVHFEAPSAVRRFRPAKAVYSYILASAALVMALPFLGLLAVLIRLTSPGPAMFIQERIGVNRRPFRMYKFRTMYEGAEKVQAEIEEFNESGQGLFKIRNDPRVTPVGRFLRRFSLDELPQLLNVLKGEMTIVGPRPLPRRDFENYYEEWHYCRHEGLPGMTCLWQVSGRSDLNFHSMCILDVYYLRNQNWILDLKIILRTFWVVLFAKGAY
ncbi:MAG: sugar transferase [Kiritimatiellae bacterium]|nr:sugar transferase [Kiritimatiellia bacterium]